MNFYVAAVAAALSLSSGNSQVLVPGLNPGGPERLTPEEFAVFELQPQRNDLPCTVTTIKPELGFDFTFHSGYEAILPMRELVGVGNRLTVLLRVIPQDREGRPVYMSQKVRVPPLKKSVQGSTSFLGTFVLGEGKYHIDWLMRDQGFRVCTKSWNLEVKLNPKDSKLKPWLQEVSAQPSGKTLFGEEAPIRRGPRCDLLKVDVIVNFSPQNPYSTVLAPEDLQGLVGTLRRIAQDPRIGEYSLVACSFQAQKVLQRQENTSQIDFPSIGEAFRSLNLGIVDVTHLSLNMGPVDFVTGLMGERLMQHNRDALIIVGPKNSLGQKMPRELLASLGDSNRPIFYLNYNLDPSGNPWRDFMGSIVRSRAGIEYTITEPMDLFKAWSDVVSRLTNRKQSGPLQAENCRESADTQSGAKLPQP